MTLLKLDYDYPRLYLTTGSMTLALWSLVLLYCLLHFDHI